MIYPNSLVDLLDLLPKMVAWGSACCSFLINTLFCVRRVQCLFSLLNSSFLSSLNQKLKKRKPPLTAKTNPPPPMSLDSKAHHVKKIHSPCKLKLDKLRHTLCNSCKDTVYYLNIMQTSCKDSHNQLVQRYIKKTNKDSFKTPSRKLSVKHFPSNSISRKPHGKQTKAILLHALRSLYLTMQRQISTSINPRHIATLSHARPQSFSYLVTFISMHITFIFMHSHI